MTGPILILLGIVAVELMLRQGLRPLQLLGEAAAGTAVLA